MNSSKSPITVFEHQVIRFGSSAEEQSLLHTLQSFHDRMNFPYFSLVHNGVKFSEYVGVIQVGNVLIEVLPKADKLNPTETIAGGKEKADWRNVLVGMLKYSGLFRVHAPTSGNLKLRSNSILDLYFEIFLSELDSLLRSGLIKKYRQEESNKKTLKGKLLFSKNILKNTVHKENFYTQSIIFDVDNIFNSILNETLKLISNINGNPEISGIIGDLSLRFPEVQSRIITVDSFDRLSFDRKTEAYRPAIDIARLLLLNFHPDITAGRNHVLALMFDMNLLWERFVFAAIRRNISTFGEGSHVFGQSIKPFWTKSTGGTVSIRPDIVLKNSSGQSFVLDTKWKNLSGQKPSVEDLRQMYVYLDFFNSRTAALVFPGNSRPTKGSFYSSERSISDRECSLVPIPLNPNILEWQKEISTLIANWISKSK